MPKEVATGFNRIVSQYRPSVAEAITIALGNPTLPRDAIAPVQFHFGWINESGQPEKNDIFPGKGVRPVLLAMTYEALGGNPENITPLGAALELIHNFSLIHDDIEDRDRMRHDRRTVWATKRWGEAQAINAGDYLLILALQQINLLRDRGFTSDQVLDTTGIVLHTAQRLAEGQHMDIAFENRTDIPLEDYFEMIKGKTGAMIETPILLAAYLQGTDDSTREQLTQYADAMGRIFQIHDDYLGIWGKSNKTGKPNDSDIKRRKKSYPVLYALHKAQLDETPDSPEKALLRNFYNHASEVTDTEVMQVRKALEFFGAKEATSKIVENYHQIATSAISESSLRIDQQANFITMADFFAMRTH